MAAQAEQPVKRPLADGGRMLELGILQLLQHRNECFPGGKQLFQRGLQRVGDSQKRLRGEQLCLLRLHEQEHPILERACRDRPGAARQCQLQRSAAGGDIRQCRRIGANGQPHGARTRAACGDPSVPEQEHRLRKQIEQAVVKHR